MSAFPDIADGGSLDVDGYFEPRMCSSTAIKQISEQLAGPFQISEKVGNSYRLDLPESVKVHPIFAPEKLRKATRSEPLEGQLQDPQPAIEVNGQSEREVEEILASKLTRNKLLYKVKWIGFDKDYEWYPASDFKNAPYKIKYFHTRYFQSNPDPRNSYLNG
jgi:Chromo (CHRromatin Organisation MOdifier) domain